jgi:glycosyltransferase involved in cell wall biosynthesis
LGFGTYDAGRHPRIAVLLQGFAAAGDQVTVANVPMGFSTADRLRMVQRPWLAYRLVIRLARCWTVLARRSVAARRRGPLDAVVVGYLGHFDVLLARMLFPRTVVVLDMLIFGADTARDRRVRSPLRLRLLRALDRLAMAAADLVVVDTEESAQLAGPFRRKVVVAPVGVTAEWLTAGAVPRSAADGSPLSVVFYGLFTPLQGTAAIGQAVGALADDGVSVTMIGRGQDRDAAAEAATGNPHVSWRDWVPAEDLPEVVRRHDVCLGIFGTGPKASRVVPNKVYQGAAAGCVVVTSDTAPQRRALGDAALYVPPGDGTALAAVLRALAKNRSRVEQLQRAARDRALRSFTPAAVAAPLRTAIVDRLSGGRRSAAHADS